MRTFFMPINGLTRLFSIKYAYFAVLFFVKCTLQFAYLKK